MENLYNSRTYLFFFGFFFGSLMVLLTALSCQQGPNNEIQYQTANIANYDNSQEQDAQFLVDAVEIHMMEIQLGQLAQKKASTSVIRDLGKRMEEEHHESYKKLITLAKEKLVTLPTITTKRAQAAYDKLNEKSDTSFNKAYCKMMVSEHKDAIALYEKVSLIAKDPDIKAWARSTLPILKVHLEDALQCQKNDEAL